MTAGTGERRRVRDAAPGSCVAIVSITPDPAIGARVRRDEVKLK